MKRLLLAAVALVGTYGLTNANTVTVHNLTACSFNLNFGSSGGFAAPGTSTFSSIPLNNIIACKIIYGSGASYISIGVGLPPGYPPYANSSMYTTNPPCLSSSFYTVSWSQSTATSDATLVIF